MNLFVRLQLSAIFIIFEDYLRARDLEFVPLTPHCFDKNGQVKLTPT